VQTWILSNPCFYLLAQLLLLLILLPVFENSDTGHRWFMVMNLLILISAVVTLGRLRFFFWVTLLLAGAAFGLLVASYVTGSIAYLAWSCRCSIGVFIVTIVHLIHYLLHPADEKGTMIDRLYGGAAAYLLLGLLWCYLYAIREYFSPNSFAGLGPSKVLYVTDLVFFSFGALTTAGGGGLVPQGKVVQTLVLLEEVVGTLYMGAFVARLVAMYASARPGPDGGAV
jgi:hypothetical protein